MRLLFYVIGLVVVAAVIALDVDAIQCYVGLGNDEAGRFKGDCRPGVTECYKFDGEVNGQHRIVRGCAGPGACNGKGMLCCSTDLCNGGDNH
ncbi:hypothetical protein AAVH_33066 [Aphelenchoides avenae]|nr:hypothetical protein AAVH_33066 [Aphelenchus avenae]